MAEADAGEVLFQRGEANEEEEEDIWDDTALIKAYDEAVSLMKMKVAEQNGTPFAEPCLPKVSGKQKQRKKNPKKNKKKRKWKIGDMCRAKFSEDGLVYEAEILSVDKEADSCFIRYTGYGNEEEQKLSDIMYTRKKKTESDMEGTDSGTDFRSNRSSGHHAHHRPRSVENSSSRHPPPLWTAGSRDEPGIPGFAMPNFPVFPGFPPPPSQPHPSSSRIPPIPPPPPPPMCGDTLDGDNEAMCSMLMSWYMSGYHTGYYQGLQQGRKESGASSPYVNR